MQSSAGGSSPDAGSHTLAMSITAPAGGDTTGMRSILRSGAPGGNQHSPSREILRRGLIGLAALTTGGIAADLAVERHWREPIQLIPWAAVALLASAIVLLLRARRTRTVHVARAAAALVVLASAAGVFEHVAANYAAGAFEPPDANVWAQMSEVTRWWLALTRSIGVAPPFAPGALGEAGLSVLLATIGDSGLDTTRAEQVTVAHDLTKALHQPVGECQKRIFVKN